MTSSMGHLVIPQFEYLAEGCVVPENFFSTACGELSSRENYISSSRLSWQILDCSLPDVAVSVVGFRGNPSSSLTKLASAPTCWSRARFADICLSSADSEGGKGAISGV